MQVCVRDETLSGQSLYEQSLEFLSWSKVGGLPKPVGSPWSPTWRESGRSEINSLIR
jgi:hypothetical protein